MTSSSAILLTALLAVAGVTFFLISVFLERMRMTRRVRLAIGGTREAGAERRVGAGMKSGVSRLAASLGALMPLSEEDREKIAVGLQRAAFRSDNAVSVVLGMKFACLLVGLAVGLTVLPPIWPGLMGWGIGVLGGLLGGVVLNLLPEFAVSRLAAARFRRIHGGLADAFDLLIVCLESGLTFDRALRRTVDNLKTFQPDLARELGQASLDMSVHGRTRQDALGRLAARLDSHQSVLFPCFVTLEQRAADGTLSGRGRGFFAALCDESPQQRLRRPFSDGQVALRGDIAAPHSRSGPRSQARYAPARLRPSHAVLSWKPHRRSLRSLGASSMKGAARRFRAEATRWGDLRNLAEVPMFVASQATRLV